MKLCSATLAMQYPDMEPWDLARKLSRVTCDPASPRDRPVSAEARQLVPMWLFVADRQRVVCRRPVQVEIREEHGEVIAACERLHVFASGKNYDEAIESLNEQVVHFCHEYKGLAENEVIGQAVHIRDLYHRYFDIDR